MKRKVIALAAAGLVLGTAGCSSQADTVSRNLSQDADSFRVQRRIVFYNAISGKPLFEVEGLCSLGNTDTGKRMSVTCKTGPNEYKKHYLGLSDNVSFFAEQIEAKNVSPFYYRVTLTPQSVIPDVDVQGSADLPDNQG